MENIQNLKEKKVAIITTHGFEEIELTGPKEELENNGAQVDIVAAEPSVKSWQGGNWGKLFETDCLLQEAQSSDYDALIIPGGTLNADKLRRDEKAIQFIRDFDKENKPIAAICHGPQLLIEADLVKGKKMTSHRAIRKDMINAGADFQEYSVVADVNYVTAEGKADVASFLKMITSILKVTENVNADSR